MKIAVPVNNDFVNEHFGNSETFKIYTISDNRKIESVFPATSSGGCGCKSGIVATLAQLGVSVMLTGNIGGGAINHMNEFGIEIIRGCSGPADQVVKAFLEGMITDNKQTCSHHEGCEEH